MRVASRRIDRYLIHDVTLVRFPGVDDYQEPLLATPAAEVVKGRFEYDRHKVIAQTGEEVFCDGRLFLKPDEELAFRDLVRYAGRDWRIMRIDKLEGWAPSHLEVHLA